MKRLHSRIKVMVIECDYGSLALRPISSKVRSIIAASNMHDHKCEVFCQSPFDTYTGIDFTSMPKSMLYRGEINSGAIVLIDSWTFRHMVGGQCD